MDWVRAAVAVTVGVILVTTLLSGPLVGAVDLTLESATEERPIPGTIDRATVEVIEPPDGPVVLDQGEFGNEVYQLLVPPLTVRVSDVRGRPTVAYKVRIFGLGYTRVTSYILDADSATERQVLEVTKTTFPPADVIESSYRAKLFVTVHETNRSRIVFETNTTVVVQD